MSREDEARAAYADYVAVRERIMAGELGWDALERFFTADAVFIDPAWGRVEGIDELRRFWVESMQGLEDWTFPEIWTVVEGDRVVSMWEQHMAPGHAVPGISVLRYAGDGKSDYELDVMNMAHVMEVITATGWVPSGDFHMPPADPDRNWREPGR
jgi:hypothetical protein